MKNRYKYDYGVCSVCNKPAFYKERRLCGTCYLRIWRKSENGQQSTLKFNIKKRKRKYGVCSKCGADANSFKNKMLCFNCQRKETSKKWREKKSKEGYYTELYRNNRESCKISQKKCTLKLKYQVFEAYGDKCACCGETEQAFLTIDHIFGGGRRHFIATKGKVYRDIRNSGFSKNQYRLLCMNCNFAVYRLGKCPHPNGVVKGGIIEMAKLGISTKEWE